MLGASKWMHFALINCILILKSQKADNCDLCLHSIQFCFYSFAGELMRFGLAKVGMSSSMLLLKRSTLRHLCISFDLPFSFFFSGFLSSFLFSHNVYWEVAWSCMHLGSYFHRLRKKARWIQVCVISLWTGADDDNAKRTLRAKGTIVAVPLTLRAFQQSSLPVRQAPPVWTLLCSCHLPFGYDWWCCTAMRAALKEPGEW